MNCGCEHGMKCTRISACAVDDMVSEAVWQAESNWEDKRAAFVAKVREAVEGMEHEEDCPAEHCVVCGNTDSAIINHYFGSLDSHNFKAGECTCPRGRLLAICEEQI